jgi:hypothetical protein
VIRRELVRRRQRARKMRFSAQAANLAKEPHPA